MRAAARRPVRRAAQAGALVLAGLLGAALAAPGASGVTGNPWPHEMDGDGDGVVVTGDDGAQNDSALLVEDHLGQPVFSVLEAGGAAVLGDDFRVLDANLAARVTLSASVPDQSACVANGLLWIGGPGGQTWRCADLGGGFGWWPAE